MWLLGLVLPQRGRLLVWLVTPFFIAANLWKFSPDMINNHKFVNFFIEGLAIVAAGWFAAGWQLFLSLIAVVHKRQMTNFSLAVPFAGMVLAITLVFGLGMSLSGIVDAAPIINDHRYTINDWSSQPVALWLLDRWRS